MMNQFVDILLVWWVPAAGIEAVLAASEGSDVGDHYLARHDLTHGTLSSLTS